MESVVRIHMLSTNQWSEGLAKFGLSDPDGYVQHRCLGIDLTESTICAMRPNRETAHLWIQ